MKPVLFAVCAAWMMLAGVSAHALEAPIVKVSRVRDFGRITFEWQSKIRFTAQSKGKTITIHFDRPSDLNSAAILSNLNGYVTRAEKANNGRTLILTLAKPYPIRSFTSGTSTGVDILKLGDAPAAKTPDTPVQKKPAVKTTPKEKIAVAKKSVPKKEQKPLQPLTKIKPRASDEKKPSLKAPVPQPAPAKKEKVDAADSPIETQKQEIQKESAAPPAPSPLQPAEPVITPQIPAQPDEAQKEKTQQENATPQPQSQQAQPVTPQMPAPREETVQAATPEPSREPVKASAPKMPPAAVMLHLPSQDTARAAIFQRGPIVWIVLDKPVALDAHALAAASGGFLQAAEPLNIQGATVLRFTALKKLGLSAVKDDAGRGWVIGIHPAALPAASPVEISVERGAQTALLAKTRDAANPLLLADPLTHETFTVIPLGAPGAGMFPPRRFVDVELPYTTQGIAVRAQSDGVVIETRADGVHITKPKGLTVSDRLPALAPEEWLERIGGQSSTLFPYATWKLHDENGFTLQEKILRTTIRNAGKPEEKNAAHLALAQLYLGQGMAAEASGMLDIIQSTAPEWYAQKKLAALRGAAHFLQHHMSDAYADFNAPELSGEEEIIPWLSTTIELLGGEAQPFDFPSFEDRYIHHYPPILWQKLAIIAADKAINHDDAATALKIFDGLKKGNVLKPVQAYVDFMRGVIAAKEGQTQAALDIWKPLAADLSDRFVRARAEYSRISLELNQKTLSPEDAIKQLDRLRIVWRGDSLELNLLTLLSQLYMDQKNYSEALRTLREIVSNFGATAEAANAAAQMASLFIQLFNDKAADSLPPLQALSLYYEFRELTPIGKAGDQMIQNLADRLVNVDLLERAAALLNHQVRYRLEGEDRSRVGARLALIYLMNRQPKEAREALELSGYGNNPEELAKTRNYLGAKVLSDMGDYESALAILKQDFSEEAHMLRVNVYWAAKDWKQVANAVEEMLGRRPNITAPLDLKESEYLLKLALAYVFENDRTQLQYLRDYFGPLMKDNPNRDVFFFITDSDSPLDTKNFGRVSKDIARIRSFLGSYEKKVKKEGLSGVI